MHYTHEEIKLKLSFRSHMEDHVIWSRSYMVSLLANLSDIDNVKERLLRNQDAMGNCMREFFGDIVSDNLISLRKNHINSFVDLLDAIKNGDVAKISNIEGDLVTNVENISTLLSIANPLYQKEELIDMLNTQLILAKYEFIARISGDYNADILYFDMSMHHAIMLSDYFVKGLIERFFEERMMDTYPEQYIGNFQKEQTDKISNSQYQEETITYDD